MKEQLGYAVNSDSDIYHLYDFGSERTLCGLSATLKPCQEALAIGLRVIADVPQNARLCRHCDDAADALRAIGQNVYSGF